MWSYFLALILPLLAIASLLIGHPEYFLITVLLVIPVLDALIGRLKSRNYTINEKSLEYLATFHIPHIYQTLWLVVIGIAGYKSINASILEFAFILCVCSLMAALVTVPAHEFMHRDCEHSRLAADIAFAIVGYGHYTISHHIHHVKAGVHKYGSAPSLGDNVWSYFPRSWMNAFSASWRSEVRKNKFHLFKNKVLRQWIITLIVMSIFILILGVRGFVLFLAPAIFSVFFVEAAGYIQHYGLTRSENDPYVKDLVWDSDHWLSNKLLMNNPLHAHHHREPMAVYMTLEPISAKLPTGYFTLIWLSLIPPIWHALMDKRVRQMQN